MDESRREFIRKAGYTALGIGVGCAGAFPLLAAADKALAVEHVQVPPGTKQWGMVIDIKKCMNEKLVNACIDACHTEHNVPKIPNPEEEIKWIWTENYENTFADQAHSHMAEDLKQTKVLVLCNHCTKPSCVRVCPTQATWKRASDGIVMMDMHRCIGCRYCMAACPFGARSFNWSNPQKYLNNIRPEYPTRTTGVVEKCTFCAERLRQGLQPACVETAGKIVEGALVFGNLGDPESEVSHILREKHTIVRRLELGTGPNIYYIV